ncbi:MAG TPA: hypothetical protein VF832_04785 [Longimicrobiales bacterium]
MTLQRSISRPAALAAVLVLAGAAAAAAQERPLFEWNGRVDREVRLVMQDRALHARFAGWKDRFGRDQTRVFSVLPREDGYVTVRVLHGRGDVDVVEQPSGRNGYTAVIRIADDRSGSSDYRLQAFWRPARGGWGWGNAPWNRGRDRDDHDRDDRRGDDRRDNGGWNGGGWNNGGWNDGGWNDGGWSNGRGTLHWSGAVDDQVEIRIQGRDVRYVNLSGNGTRDVRQSMNGELPRREVSLHLDKHQGRGQVDVVQQPTSWNGYTAVIRVRDGRAGADYYDFDVSW